MNKVISWIAKREEEILLRHMKMDERRECRLGEAMEKYVNVGERGWLERYKKLGTIKNYKEGLVWVLQYYMGVSVKRWKSSGLGKMVMEIEKEKDVNDVEEMKIELDEKYDMTERRKGWKNIYGSKEREPRKGT